MEELFTKINDTLIEIEGILCKINDNLIEIKDRTDQVLPAERSE